jgi:alpha-glucosidase
MNQRDKLWWRHGIFYQIYPRSFQDTNADGVGDIAGIIERLPYLQSLGVDAIWLSPIFPSPMADFGYDIADYTGIDPLFGTMADFDALVKAAHASGLKVILDLVPNHTSDQHPWFVESRGSRDNPKRDWYIWRDPAADGGPPNNWLSEFGGRAWQYDASTRQYYYHAFLAQQPDLNWRNPEVRRAIYDVMRFWLRKGVDGFRVDVIWHLIKDADFRDNPQIGLSRGPAPHEKILPLNSTDQAEVRDVIAEMRRVIDNSIARIDRNLLLEALSLSITARISRGRIYRSTLRCCRRHGTRAESRRSSLSTSQCCLKVHGRTGCLAIMIVRGWQAG